MSSEAKAVRVPFIGGNWKMNGSKKSVEALVTALNAGSVSAVDVVVAPTFIHLQQVLSSIKPPVGVAAQNSSQFPDGAVTGDISATQLKDFGVDWVIIGHSERRSKFGETDKIVAEKITAALKAGLNVIACCGETGEERKAGQTEAVVSRQVGAIAGAVSDWSRVVIAYEPVWAIGTNVTATPDQAQEVHASIRAGLRKGLGDKVADSTRIIYGGSVKADNCDSLFAKADVDGFLVGGASLVAKDFLAICNAKGKSQ